jgi:hypothetical protein
VKEIFLGESPGGQSFLTGMKAMNVLSPSLAGICFYKWASGSHIGKK